MSLLAGQDNLTLGSSVRLRRTRRAEVIFGRAGSDRMRAGAGRDCVVGGAGNDLLDGGPGRDLIDCGPGRRDRVRNCERRLRS